MTPLTSEGGQVSHDGDLPGVPDAARESLGVAEGLMDSVDPVWFSRSFAGALASAAKHPLPTGRALLRFAGGLSQAALAGVDHLAGGSAPGPAALGPKDRRFAETTWVENPAFFGLLQAYLVSCRLFGDLVECSQLEGSSRAKAEFAATLAGDALAPTNFLPTNPAALRRAFETGGQSLLRGLRNFAGDVRHNGGWPSQVDSTPFELGRNMAATPGRVVFRNDLIELIQYAPTTPDVHTIPLLMCPPWINKYYIMDLAPGRSLVEWAVAHGLTTFAISYRNPDSTMRDVGFDDYLLQGPRAAIDVVRSITGSETVNTLAVCLGGTLHTALLAYLNAKGERDLIHSSTYLNSLTDHAGAGTLSGVFTDEATVEGLERKMEAKGYLDARTMAQTFNLLRANDLIFNYVASNWLMGNKPPAFDLLTWNNDSTRMPAKMHSFYLRHCWLNNDLAHDRMELAGETLAVSKIDVDTYIVAAAEDHIVPWRSSYKSTQIFQGDCRFVLSSSGHIAGIVNPPSPKTRLWTNPELPGDPDAWRAGATEHQDTWWNDWIPWITRRSGDLGAAPPLGNEEYPVLGEAPGSYVHG